MTMDLFWGKIIGPLLELSARPTSLHRLIPFSKIKLHAYSCGQRPRTNHRKVPGEDAPHADEAVLQASQRQHEESLCQMWFAQRGLQLQDAPLGENKVKDYIKEACRQMGYEGGTGHAFRHLAITTNANDPAVSVEQALRFAGHGSVAAQRPYMRVDETSEAAMMGALGIVPLKKEDADKKPAAKEDGADGTI